MYSLMKILRLIGMQARGWRHKPIFYLGLLLGVTFALEPTVNFMRLAKSYQAPVQVLEGFILMGASHRICLPLMLGLFMMLSDMPFLDERIGYVGLRVTRGQWMAAQLGYIAFSCAVYLGVILVFSAAILSANGYLGNVYSQAMTAIANDDDYRLYETYDLIFNRSGFMSLYSVTELAGLTFALLWAYAFVLGGTMFVLSLYFRRGIALAAGLTIHQVGYVLIREGAFWANQRVSPMAHALTHTHSLPEMEQLVWNYPLLSESALVFTGWIVLICVLCALRAPRQDFLAPHRNLAE